MNSWAVRQPSVAESGPAQRDSIASSDGADRAAAMERARGPRTSCAPGPTDARSVCLITPPSAFLLDERVFVSLGVLKVAASLRRSDHRVNFLDLSGVENYLAPLEDYFAASQDAADRHHQPRRRSFRR